MEEAAFTLAYGGMDTFFGGLERLLGPPSPNLQEAMRREHCASADSKEYFTSANYGVTTTSQIEWLFVVEPQDGLRKLRLAAWPHEQKLLDAAEQMRASGLLRRSSTSASLPGAGTAGDGGDADVGDAVDAIGGDADGDVLQREEGSVRSLVGDGDEAGAEEEDPTLRMREPQSIASFESRWAQIDEKLEELDMDCLQKVEFLAARLYTGPLYQKYNACLRCAPQDPASRPAGPSRTARARTRPHTPARRRGPPSHHVGVCLACAPHARAAASRSRRWSRAGRSCASATGTRPRCT